MSNVTPLDIEVTEELFEAALEFANQLAKAVGQPEVIVPEDMDISDLKILNIPQDAVPESYIPEGIEESGGLAIGAVIIPPSELEGINHIGAWESRE